MARQNIPVDPSFNIWKPLPVSAWLTFFVGGLFVGVVMLLQEVILRIHKEGEKPLTFELFMEIILKPVYMLIEPQPWTSRKDTFMMSLVFFLWSFACFYFVASYSCNLRSILVRKPFEPPAITFNGNILKLIYFP